MMILIGAIFLWRTIHPDTAIFELLATYWPLLLILWGAIRLVEVMVWQREDSRPRSFSGGEIVLIIMICVIGSGLWQARQHGFG
ncbi:MAG TPA: hypothetical protein VKE70_02760, partial [Candidatus Solibacter sp.]|nr:hypothetical protein [Candidatus Solibacter sp.]